MLHLPCALLFPPENTLHSSRLFPMFQLREFYCTYLIIYCSQRNPLKEGTRNNAYSNFSLTHWLSHRRKRRGTRSADFRSFSVFDRLFCFLSVYLTRISVDYCSRKRGTNWQNPAEKTFRHNRRQFADTNHYSQVQTGENPQRGFSGLLSFKMISCQGCRASV